jgi:hypothetical protein
MSSPEVVVTGLIDCSPQSSLAYLEMATILAKVIYHFDMELDTTSMNPAHDWREQKVYIVWAKQPLMVKLTARDVAIGGFGAGKSSSTASES